MQYSLKSLFLATAGVAALFGVACALPDPLSATVMLYVTLVLPGATIALACYGRGYPQSFAIGCLLSPAGSAFFVIPIFVWIFMFDRNANLADIANSVVRNPPALKLGIVVFHAMNISCGLMALAVRWFIQSARSRENNARMKLLAMHGKAIILPSNETYTVIQGRVRLPEHNFASLEPEMTTADR
jgi:hypothetical protein